VHRRRRTGIPPQSFAHPVDPVGGFSSQAGIGDVEKKTFGVAAACTKQPDVAEVHQSRPSGGQQRYRKGRRAGDAQGPGQVAAGTAGDDSKSYRWRGTFREQAVEHLVYRAVPAHGNDAVLTVNHPSSGERL
jgi:hypothetical protein